MKPTHLLALAAFAVLATVGSAKVTEKFAQTYALDANGTIQLENVNGSVEIVAWDRNEVSLEAEKSARNEEGLARMQLRIQSDNRRLAIKTEYEKKWRFWENMNAQVHYKLMVPAGVALDQIEVVNADIRVKDVRGAVHLESVNGGIEAEGIAGPGSFETVNGTIRVSYAAMPEGGRISLDTVNGTCKLALPADAAFDFDADTVNGRIHCDFPITLRDSGKREMHGSVAGGGTRVSLESVNGSLTVERAR